MQTTFESLMQTPPSTVGRVGTPDLLSVNTPTPVGPRRGTQSVKWCFTLNNYSESDELSLRQLGWDANTKYLVFGREVAETGTPHLQCFLWLNRARRFHIVLRSLPTGVHLESANGTAWEAAHYCWKEEDYEEFGTRPPESHSRGSRGGQRNAERYQEAWDAAVQGRLEDIPIDLRIKHYSTFKNIMKDNMITPAPLTTCAGLWIHGATGTGKSHSVITQHPDRYIKPLNKWWDGYQGQETVHLDELDPSHSTWISAYLKKWADKWPFDAEIKGGALQIRPQLVVVTSNYKIDDMGFPDGCLDAIKRRFREVEKFRDQEIFVR